MDTLVFIVWLMLVTHTYPGTRIKDTSEFAQKLPVDSLERAEIDVTLQDMWLKMLNLKPVASHLSICFFSSGRVSEPLNVCFTLYKRSKVGHHKCENVVEKNTRIMFCAQNESKYVSTIKL